MYGTVYKPLFSNTCFSYNPFQGSIVKYEMNLKSGLLPNSDIFIFIQEFKIDVNIL